MLFSAVFIGELGAVLLGESLSFLISREVTALPVPIAKHIALLDLTTATEPLTVFVRFNIVKTHLKHVLRAPCLGGCYHGVA